MQENLPAPIDALESVAKTIQDNRPSLIRAQAGDRTRIAEFCSGLADTLSAISGALRAGRVPSAECARLDTYESAAPTTFSGVLTEDAVRRIQGRLAAAREPSRYPEILAQAEAGHEQIDSPSGTLTGAAAELAHLDEAAAILREISDSTAEAPVAGNPQPASVSSEPVMPSEPSRPTYPEPEPLAPRTIYSAGHSERSDGPDRTNLVAIGAGSLLTVGGVLGSILLARRRQAERQRPLSQLRRASAEIREKAPSPDEIADYLADENVARRVRTVGGGLALLVLGLLMIRMLNRRRHRGDRRPPASHQGPTAQPFLSVPPTPQ